MTPSLTGARVVVVSGKGGVGKTTVAAALALAAAGERKRVLLAELEDREAFAPLFGRARLTYKEQQLTPSIWGLTVEVDEALVEYLRLFYGIPRLSRALIRSRAVEFATHTAPGLKDILLIGKIKSAESERTDGRLRYDQIVVDAPPTGRLPRFLDAPRAIVELVGAGPIRRQAKSVRDMVEDPRRLQVVLVTHPEEMAVRETIEAAETLGKMGVALGPIVVNGLVPSIPNLGRDPEATLRAQAREENLALDEAAIAELARVAASRARRARNQRKAIAELNAALDLPHVELPLLFTDGIGRAELDLLAARLREPT